MQAMEGPIQEQQPAMVKIITSDCPDGFEVERVLLIMQSETAKMMLSAPSGLSLEAQTNEISFSDITQQTFNIIYQCMKIVHEQRPDVRKIDSIRAILDRINNGEIAINPTKIKEILYAANFLDASAVLQAVARQYAIYVHDNRITLDDLNDFIADVLPEIARQYYLSYGEPLQHPSIKDCSWGVSVRELLENDRVPRVQGIAVDFSPGYKLDLSGRYINNLDGLQDIPGIYNVTLLYLEHNRIATIQQAFNELGSLERLYLGHNRIATIEKDVLNGLASLNQLNLDHNQITTIEQGAFNGLNRLRWLHLEHNQITTIQQGAFNGLKSLKYLYLEHNQIAAIEQGVFNGLNSVWLNLEHNQITEQDQTRLRQEFSNVQNAQIYLENQRKPVGLTAIFRPEIKKKNIINKYQLNLDK